MKKKYLTTMDSYHFKGAYDTNLCAVLTKKEQEESGFLYTGLDGDKAVGFENVFNFHNSSSSRDSLEFNLFTASDESRLVHFDIVRTYDKGRFDLDYITTVTVMFCDESKHLEECVVKYIENKCESEERCKKLELTVEYTETFVCTEEELTETISEWGCGIIEYNKKEGCIEFIKQNNTNTITPPTTQHKVSEVDLDKEGFPF